MSMNHKKAVAAHNRLARAEQRSDCGESSKAGEPAPSLARPWRRRLRMTLAPMPLGKSED